MGKVSQIDSQKKLLNFFNSGTVKDFIKVSFKPSDECECNNVYFTKIGDNVSHLCLNGEIISFPLEVEKSK